MRWVIGLLVIANLAFAGVAWVTTRKPSPDAQLVNLEMNADKLKLLESKPAAGAAAAPSGPAPAACLEWGRFSAAELERVRARIAELAPKARTTARELADAPSWWVHVPPFKSRDEAQRRVAELEALGVTELVVVTDNDRWRNAISLGIFKSEEAAAARLAALRERKVDDAVTGQRNGLLRLSVLTIREPGDALVGAVAGLRGEFPGSELRAVACPGGGAPGKGG